MKFRLPVSGSKATVPEAPSGIETKLNGLNIYLDLWYIESAGVYRLLSSVFENLPFTLKNWVLKLPSIKGI